MEAEPNRRLPRDFRPTLRTVDVSELARALRSAVSLDPDRPDPAEAAAWHPEPEPTQVSDVDVVGWVAWSLAGLRVFAAREGAVLRHAREQGQRVLAVLAMVRARGGVSQASRLLGAPRKVVRDALRRAGMYPWPGGGVAPGEQGR